MQQPLRNFAKSLGVYSVDCAMRRWGGMPKGSLMHAVARGCSILLLAVLPFAGQSPQPIPVFSRESIGAVGRSARVLAPGMVLMLYGGHLAPEPVCGQPTVQPALELCGVRVLIDTAPAELLYVSSGQINFKIPADVPMEGFAPLRVCVGAACSTPVPMWFSTRTALISLEKPAYVHIPVWIRVDPPPPYSVSYPCWNGPWMPPGYEFEVRRNGGSLAPMPQPSSPPNREGTGAERCDGPTVRSSLPLHLLYRLDEPGTYSVRFTAKKEDQVLYRSEWTDIVVGAFSEEKRDAWLQSLDSEIKINSRSIVSDMIPSLLAWPDEKALAVLLKVFPANTTRCTNFDCIKLGFGRAALAWFDDALLRTHIPPERLLHLCPPEGKCK
jgi:hypothetical protein